MEAVKCFGHGGICPGHGLDDIEEIACVDEDVGFWQMISSVIFRKVS